MIAEAKELDEAATEFVIYSDNTSCTNVVSFDYMFFTDQQTGELMVVEGSMEGDDLRESTATEWLGKLSEFNFDEPPTSIYDITYLKIAIKQRLRALEGAKV